MLDEKLLQERLNQFKPEPLIDYVYNEDELLEIPVVQEDENTIDLAKTNYLDVLNNEEIKKKAEEFIRHYGVGTCGPRAFYGTTDVHLNLEEGMAEFLGVEEIIIYSYGFVAISSSIAAYCKKQDTVFVDKDTNFAIVQGLIAARSRVVYFDHNDPKSFREKAEQVVSKESKTKRSRKFLIIEGISWKTGKLCPLIDFIRVAEDFKMRIFLEESYTVGVFGENGRGLTEHFHVPVEKVDMIFGTLEGALGSIGGFCGGSHAIIEHQRLSGSGYIFSASLPTYLAQVVLESIKLMGDKPRKFMAFTQEFHDFLQTSCQFDVISDPKSPFKLFKTFKDPLGKKLDSLHEYCLDKGVKFIKNENGLLINLNIKLKDDEERLQIVYRVLKEAAELAHN